MTELPLFESKWEAECAHAREELEAAARSEALATIAALADRYRITVLELASLGLFDEVCPDKVTLADISPYAPCLGRR